MYVRMITYHIRSGVERWQANAIYDDLIGVLESLDGYQGCALLLNDAMKTAISLTYWRNETCAGEAGKTLLPLLFERTADLSDRPPEVNGYQVLDYKLADGDRIEPA